MQGLERHDIFRWPSLIALPTSVIHVYKSIRQKIRGAWKREEEEHLSAILLSIQTGEFSDASFKEILFRFLSCEFGQTIIETLIAAADVSTQTSDNIDDEQMRIRNTHQHIVQLLANSAGNRDFYDDNDATVLHIAARYGWLEIVQSLLKEGADPNAKDKEYNTPLLTVMNDQENCSPLLSVMDDQHKRLVDLLIESGADVFCSNMAGSSLLHAASSRGWVDKVQFLLDKGVDPNTPTTVGFTPLHLACLNSHISIVALLLDNGAVTTCITFLRYTPLHIAAKKNNLEIVKYLVEKGADINDTRFQGLSPLNVACREQKIENIEYLVNAGNIQNGSNETPLKFIIRHHPNLDLIKTFVERYGYLNNFIDDYYGESEDFSQLNDIFQNVEVCAQAIINKFNNKDLPELYNLPLTVGTLPPIHKMMITSREAIQDVEGSVRNEINENAHCDLRKPKVILLRMLSVKSYIDYYKGVSGKAQLKRPATASDSGEPSCSKIQCLE